MMKNKAARRYTVALYEAAKDLNLLERTAQDFSEIRDMIERTRELKLFLQSPIINPVKKRKIIREIFQRIVNDLSMKFIEIICDRRRENILYDISKDYLQLLNEKRNIAVAKIKTVVEITEADRKALVERLKKYTGKDIKPVFQIDKEIKGGFVAQVDDTIIDASIKRQLELLKEQFSTGTLRN